MRGRPSQLTDDARLRLDREADIVAQRTRYKTIAVELGLKPEFVRNYISRALRDRKLIKGTKASNSER